MKQNIRLLSITESLYRQLSKITKEQIDQLVLKFQKGNNESFMKLYEHFYVKIFRYIYVKCGQVQDSENLTQEVFIKAYKSIASFKFKVEGDYRPSFSSWIFTIARNQTIDYFRKNSGKIEPSIYDITEKSLSTSSNLEEKLDDKLLLNKVVQNMQYLTKLQKEVITLRFTSQMSLKETSIILNKNVNSIKSLQHSAIKKLRDLINE